jgi:hypothetical protein
MQDLRFFTDCKIASITQLEILKKKYPEYIFYKQDIYNAIYKLHQNNKNEKSDTILLFDSLFEKYLKIHSERFLFDMLKVKNDYLTFFRCYHHNKNCINDFLMYY